MMHTADNRASNEKEEEWSMATHRISTGETLLGKDTGNFSTSKSAGAARMT